MHPQLDSLPPEILQGIASSGPCETALALSIVNTTLRLVCHDRQVFKAILKNRSGYGGLGWDCVPLSSRSPVSSWARYALADSQARQWALNEQTDNTLPADFRIWAPQLMSSTRKSPSDFRTLC